MRKTGVQQRTEVSFAVPSRTRAAQFFSLKINACEIHENFHCKPNAMHRPVIYRSVKPLHWNVVYPTVLYDFTQNDEADRVLLRTGHHGQKSERICGMADFSLGSTPASPTRKLIIRNNGGKKQMRSNLRNGLDYKTNINIIIELNSIKDVNLIYVGQKLLLPVAASE